MKKVLSAFACAGFLIVTLESQATPITYQLSPFSGANSTLTGSITTDGNLGILSPSDIISGSFSVAPKPGHSFTTFSFSAAGASLISCNPNCGLAATASTLSFDFSSLDVLQFADIHADPGFVNVSTVVFGNTLSIVGWDQSLGDSDFLDVPRTVHGIATVAAVPEPGSLALVGIGLAAGLGVIGARGRKLEASGV